MTTMVERIARLLCAKDGGDPDEVRAGEGHASGKTRAGWEAFASTAVDLLGAMREPTATMVKAGWEKSPEVGAAYIAMIESAMSEGDHYKL
jgi:hypothetical protein